jgi:hypothetical protein
MGRQVSFSFIPEKYSNCHRCGMKKSGRGMGCCKDEQKLIKTDKNQKLTDLGFSTNQQKKFIIVSAAHPRYSIPIVSSQLNEHSPSHGPPEAEPVPVYLMNCLLLI